MGTEAGHQAASLGEGPQEVPQGDAAGSTPGRAPVPAQLSTRSFTLWVSCPVTVRCGEGEQGLNETLSNATHTPLNTEEETCHLLAACGLGRAPELGRPCPTLPATSAALGAPGPRSWARCSLAPRSAVAASHFTQGPAHLSPAQRPSRTTF